MCDIFFGLFMASWIVTRHVFYSIMLYSCIRHSRKLGADGRDASISWTLVSLLMALQCLLLIWLVMILKLAWRVVSGQAAADDRSDNEMDDDDDDDEISAEQTTNRSNNVGPFLSVSASLSPADKSSVSRSASSKKKPHR